MCFTVHSLCFFFFIKETQLFIALVLFLIGKSWMIYYSSSLETNGSKISASEIIKCRIMMNNVKDWASLTKVNEREVNEWHIWPLKVLWWMLLEWTCRESSNVCRKIKKKKKAIVKWNLWHINRLQQPRVCLSPFHSTIEDNERLLKDESSGLLFNLR